MNRILIILEIALCLLLTTYEGFAKTVSPPEFPQNAESAEGFIPKGYRILEDAEGDLNGDGIPDEAMVITLESSEGEEQYNLDSLESYERFLVILFRDGDHYVLKDTNSRCIWCKNCGGVFGDPFSGLTIKRQVLTISHYGGSNWRWAFDRKFRYQNNDFYLIGATDHSFWCVDFCDKYKDFGATNYTDVNFLTGQRYRMTITEDCKSKKEKHDIVAKRPLVQLKDFTESENENWWTK